MIGIFSRVTFFVIIICFSAYKAPGQSPVRELKKYFEELGQNPNKPIPSSLMKATSDDAKLLDALQHGDRWVTAIPARRNFEITVSIAERTKDIELKKNAIEWLTFLARSEDSRVFTDATASLYLFRPEHFSEMAKLRIVSALKMRRSNYAQLSRLAAGLNILEAKPDIKNVLLNERNDRVVWQLNLALARFGDQEMIDNVLHECSRQELNSTTMDYFIPGLVYTRQKDIYKYLETIVHSDEKACISPNPNSSEKILCGYKLLELLAPAIKDFPVSLDEFGDLQVNSYEKALIEVRQWFLDHPNYQIRTDTF